MSTHKTPRSYRIGLMMDRMPAAPATPNPETAGEEAYHAGKSYTVNPHARGTELHERWYTGWAQASDTNATERNTD